MNVVREITRLGQLELDAGVSINGSWHDRYKDSAYVYVGGLAKELTEGDVITIFSQYGEPVDINMPKTKDPPFVNKGFAFLMYQDQRSTVLAVDNLNGSKVLGRTLRVDHVDKYKQLERNDEGKMVERDTESRNAAPELFYNKDKGEESEPEVEIGDIDPDDPMAQFMIEERMKKARKEKKRHRTKEEKEERRERKKRKKLMKGD